MKDFVEYKEELQEELHEKELESFNSFLNESEIDEIKVDTLVDELIEKHTIDGKLDVDALLNDELTNEGAIGSIIGGIGGFALGKTIGKMVARVLGVEKGILYDLLTSRLVGAAMGAAIGKKF